MTFIKALRDLLPNGAISVKEPMAKYTSFKIGGPADILLKPSSPEELEKVCLLCNKNNWPLTLLGEGTNVLIADEGIRGVTVLTTGLNCMAVEKSPALGYITAGAGTRLAKLADTACKAGLQGLEFAQGIPGSVGGAVYMNAGAYGHDIAEVCLTVKVLEMKKNSHTITEYRGVDMGFDYRTSRIQQENAVILEAVFRLLYGDPTEIRTQINELNKQRREKQPHEPSAGSTFKRPPGYFAGKLIEDAGLKGFAVGGAKVSEKHAGFVINTGNATAEDVCRLMDEVRKRVFAGNGVWLEPEIKIIGRKYPWEQDQ
jgi:UDP-N-acetylmuramate dehydrogenase